MEITLNRLTPSATPARALPERSAELKAQAVSLPELAESLKQSDTVAVFAQVDDVLDLSKSGREILGNFEQLSPEKQAEFLQTIASLLRQGVVGYEKLEVRGEERTVHLETRIADPELRDAHSYRGSGIEPTGRHLDLPA
ncbi:MAG: hypothetical protein HYV27_19330 [Candidatus Hydrogenedentes bacterium]|nr:hypothetical protein [Candidatus Hydrogenedentota bacterium]